MDVLLDNIVPIAIVLMAILQTIGKKILDKRQGDAPDADEFELPDWARPEPQEQRQPEPPQSPPPLPPRPARPQPELISPPPASARTSTLLDQIEAAKKRAAAAKQERQRAAAKSPSTAPTRQYPAKQNRNKLGWLESKESLRRAIIAREVLGPPLSLRNDWPEQRG